MLPWFVIEEVFNAIWEGVSDSLDIVSDSIVLQFAIAIVFLSSVVSLAKRLTDFESDNDND